MKFDESFRARLHDLFAWRRDVRHFRPDPLPHGALDRLLGIACLSPSVGLSQPWRFVTVDDPARRAALVTIFETCNAAARAGYDHETASLYGTLKLAGLREAPAQVSVFADVGTPLGRGLGRQTMPEMAEYSVVAAICTLWLAARAEGIGLGWVSILDPDAVARVLDVPPDWRLVGHLCLGYPDYDSETPELERLGWERRAALPCAIIRR